MKTVAARYSSTLLIWGIILIPASYVADVILDAVLFGDESFWDQMFDPTYHEVAIRFLFSIFILAGIFLGRHFLGKSARKEMLLEQKNQNLERLKLDLIEFNEQAAHRLRNSSAELATAIEMLHAQDDTKLDEKTSFLVKAINTASTKLENQANITLSLTEAATGEVHQERTELDRLAREIKSDLLKAHPDRRLEFRIQDQMTAWCDRKMMHTVLRNLLANAIAFIPKNQQGQIEFGKLTREGQTIYFVRDNGIGFNDGQANRIFDPFRNLDQDPELPRDTLRLANTRRIILRHGGRIWAEGVPGAGGTIFFTDDTLKEITA